MKETCVIEPDVAIGPPSFHKSGIDIYTCPSCGCLMADVDYLSGQYENEDYYTIASADPADIDQRWGFRWRYVLKKIVDLVPADASILDVGAGNGSFVHVAREEFGVNASGIDVSEASARFARTVLDTDLIVGDVADHREIYDVVTSFNVIEHVADPVETLRTMVDRLQPGGILVLTTPNPASIQRRVRGIEKWAMICPPHHLNILTEEALTRLLGRCGLVVESHETISTYVKAVKNFDTDGLLLRRSAFNILRMAGLGADQLVIARRSTAVANGHAR